MNVIVTQLHVKETDCAIIQINASKWNRIWNIRHCCAETEHVSKSFSFHLGQPLKSVFSFPIIDYMNPNDDNS